MIEAIPAVTIAPRALPMLWRGRIPAATLSVIAGKPGLGKSTLTALMVAELSRAGLPTLVSNVEDDLHGATRPRLDVAGADLRHVHLIPSASFALPHDLDALGELIVSTRAVAVVLDPIGAHFVPERRVHDRPTLRRVIDLARSTRCALVGVHHLTKSGTFGGPYGGLLGSSRAAFVFGHDPDDRDRRALACAKANGFEEPPALLLEHDTVDYRSGGQLLEAGRLRVAGESDAECDHVLRRGSRDPDRDAACDEWLSEYLAAGEGCQRQTSELRAAAAETGYGWETVRRAGIRIRAEKLRIGFGGDGFWLWRLPDEHPLRVREGA
jgi:hypothetical protein